MRRAALVVPLMLVACSSCSGDDAQKARPTTPMTEAAPRAIDAGVAKVTPDAATPAPPATPKLAPLTEDMARPYFADGKAGEGAARFALEDWQAARDDFSAALADATDDATRARLTLLIGLCDTHLAAWKDAAGELDTARAALPVLADWIGYQEARALYFAHQPDDALARAREVASDSIVGADAELLVGDVLRSQGDAQATADHYRDYLSRRPTGPRLSEARYRLAEALGDTDESTQLYRTITIEDPLSSWAEKADKVLDKRGGAAPLTAAEHIEKAQVLFDGMRNPESEAEYAAALADASISPADKCTAAYGRAQSRYKARDRKGAAPMFDDAVAACAAAGDKDLEIKSAYNGGRSYSFIGEHETAIKSYQHAEDVDPTNSYADDAELREAEEWESLKDDDKVIATLSAIPDKFPKGDMRAEAMWRLGWKAWKDQDTELAIKWWKKQIDVAPIDDNYWAEGQAQYWLGRAYAAKKQKAKAEAWWKKCIETYPVTYYAMLSLNRLRETAPKVYEKELAAIAKDPDDYDPKAPAFHFQPRAEYATPAFARAIELLKLGLGEPAEAELRTLKLVPPSDKKRVDDPDQIEKLWAMAFLYDRAGRYATSHWPTRWHILDYKRQWPVGANRARWQVAFPKAFWALLSKAAKDQGVPIAMQIAIVREESAFDPLLESYANAIGLTQMIPPTAKRFAKGTGIDPTRDNLRDPEKNVAIGSRFLGFLWNLWSGFATLVPPSYNAGEGAVRKMLKLRGTWPADEFIEAIVDDQARNYSKRVLGSYFAYTWLYEQKVPELSNTIPAKLLPKK